MLYNLYFSSFIMNSSSLVHFITTLTVTYTRSSVSHVELNRSYWLSHDVEGSLQNGILFTAS